MNRVVVSKRASEDLIGSYLIFYKVSGNEIAIIRVIHGGRRLHNLI